MVVATGGASGGAESCKVVPAPEMAALFKIPYFDYRHGYVTWLTVL